MSDSYCHQLVCDLQESRSETDTSVTGSVASVPGKPELVFDCVCFDAAGPILVKYESIHKPHFTKGYVEVFVCLEAKALHFKLILNLIITSTFIATLQRFTGH